MKIKEVIHLLKENREFLEAIYNPGLTDEEKIRLLDKITGVRLCKEPQIRVYVEFTERTQIQNNRMGGLKNGV